MNEPMTVDELVADASETLEGAGQMGLYEFRWASGAPPADDTTIGL